MFSQATAFVPSYCFRLGKLSKVQTLSRSGQCDQYINQDGIRFYNKTDKLFFSLSISSETVTYDYNLSVQFFMAEDRRQNQASSSAFHSISQSNTSSHKGWLPVHKIKMFQRGNMPSNVIVVKRKRKMPKSFMQNRWILERMKGGRDRWTKVDWFPGNSMYIADLVFHYFWQWFHHYTFHHTLQKLQNSV